MTHFLQTANNPEWPEDFEVVSRHSTEKSAIRAGCRLINDGAGYSQRDIRGEEPWWIVAEWVRGGRVVARVVR